MTTAVESPRKEADAMLGALTQHWLETRLDNPLHFIARLDDAAKHILVVAGILQGILIVVVKVDTDAPARMRWFSLAALGALVITALLATLTLFVQSNRLGAHPIYKKVRKLTSDNELWDGVDSEIEGWCRSIDRIASQKRVLLSLAMFTLVASMSFALACAWDAMHTPDNSPAPAVSATAPR
jgi:hypothetical protein